MSDVVELQAHAKLNLFLRVLAREAEGFHGLETLFCLVSLHDTLRIARRPARGVTLDVVGAECGPAEQNLAVRAAQMVLAASGEPFGVHITLDKRIPVQGGLGGGSSDAATALIGTNQLANDAVPRHELLQMGSRLGSDVPFFVSGAPLALGWGHGERLLRLPPLPGAPALLFVPPFGVSTPEAFRMVDLAREGIGRRGAVALEPEGLSSWGSVARLAGNDFEFALFGRHPELKRAFESLAATHPLLCRMSGSGSTIFAIYRTARERDDAGTALNPRLGRIIPVDTLGAPPSAPRSDRPQA